MGVGRGGEHTTSKRRHSGRARRRRVSEGTAGGRGDSGRASTRARRCARVREGTRRDSKRARAAGRRQGVQGVRVRGDRPWRATRSWRARGVQGHRGEDYGEGTTVRAPSKSTRRDHLEETTAGSRMCATRPPRGDHGGEPYVCDETTASEGRARGVRGTCEGRACASTL